MTSLCLLDNVGGGVLKRVHELVEQGADMEKTDGIGWTSIFFASYRGRLEGTA